MLLINGVLDDVVYDNKIIQPEVLAKAFGLPTGGIYNLYNYNPQKDQFGQIRQPRSIGTPALINVSSKRGQFQLRYYTQMIQGDKNPRYYPNDVSVSGQADFQPTQFDLFVFICLSGLVDGVEGIMPPANFKPYLRVLYPEKMEQEAQAHVTFVEKLMDQVTSMPNESLLIRARGMGISGSVSSIKVQLMKLLTTDPTSFDSKFNNPILMDQGIVLRAIDTGLIEVRPIRGVNTWVFGESTTKKGQELTVIGDASPHEVILQYISDARRRSDLLAYLSEYLKPQEVVKVLESEVITKESEELDFVDKITGEPFVKSGVIFIKKGEKDYEITPLVEDEEIFVTLRKYFENGTNRQRFLFLTKK